MQDGLILQQIGDSTGERTCFFWFSFILIWGNIFPSFWLIDICLGSLGFLCFWKFWDLLCFSLIFPGTTLCLLCTVWAVSHFFFSKQCSTAPVPSARLRTLLKFWKNFRFLSLVYLYFNLEFLIFAQIDDCFC